MRDFTLQDFLQERGYVLVTPWYHENIDPRSRAMPQEQRQGRAERHGLAANKGDAQ
jgi:hypothetical protein